ncbi:hypothetical protein NC652_025609 [Populus alba x Populus x berolinensis]|nr:hypothetical protein NC652_025609 [Populus alba x Populus x berolinensis]
MDAEIELEHWTNATLFHTIHGWANCLISPFALDTFQVILTYTVCIMHLSCYSRSPKGNGIPLYSDRGLPPGRV